VKVWQLKCSQQVTQVEEVKPSSWEPRQMKLKFWLRKLINDNREKTNKESNKATKRAGMSKKVPEIPFVLHSEKLSPSGVAFSSFAFYLRISFFSFLRLVDAFSLFLLLLCCGSLFESEEQILEITFIVFTAIVHYPTVGG
jgi:lipoprotein signal peptidase